jgi:hypothetical protein
MRHHLAESADIIAAKMRPFLPTCVKHLSRARECAPVVVCRRESVPELA